MPDIQATLDQLGIAAEATSPNQWVLRVPTEARGELPVQLSVGEHRGRLQAFLMRGPDVNHEAVYRRLLRRQLDLDAWRFAVDDDGDIYLLADISRSRLHDELDGVLGLFSITVDQVFSGLLELGFRS